MVRIMKINKKLATMCATCLFILGNTFAFQNDLKSIPDYEVEIASLFENMRSSQGDSQKLEINTKVLGLFREMLSVDGSFYFPFDSLQYLGKIYSQDQALRIYSWNVPMMDGTHRYFGFVQYKTPGKQKYKVYFLDDSEGASLSEDDIYTTTNWYGALYYEIVKIECQGELFYTVLGFAFNNYLTSYKIIDIITLSNDKLSIGAPVFPSGETKKSRMIFEFSSRVSMMMRYNSDLGMIIYDHLSPSQQDYEGQFQFYGPDSSYDGLEYRNCFWNLKEDLDLKN